MMYQAAMFLLIFTPTVASRLEGFAQAATIFICMFIYGALLAADANKRARG